MWDKLEAIVSANDSTKKQAADILARYGTPSTSIAVLDNGHIVSKCYSTVRDDEETVFQACSVSKPIAAMAVMKLVSQGRVTLDEPITTYLSLEIINAISTPETAAMLQYVTIKHLLSHTSGLTVHGFPGYAGEPAGTMATLSGDAPSNTIQVRLAALPGQRLAYSGGGITILQVIMEHITQKPFPEIMQDLVFNPLNMTRSFYKRPGKQDNHASSYYTGYQPAEVPFHVYPEQAAAGIWTTPTDLLKAVRAMQQSLTAEDDGSSAFMSRHLARTMLDEVDGGAALGWFATKKSTAFQHAGSNFGFRCHVLGYADLDADGVSVPRQAGICVMTNSEEGYGVVRKVMHAIAHIKGWPGLASANPAGDTEVPFCAGGTVSSDEWKSWQGLWGQDWRIVEVDGAPAVSLRDLPTVRLLPAAFPNMASKGDPKIDLVMEGLEMMVRLRNIDGTKAVEIWDSTNRRTTTLREQ